MIQHRAVLVITGAIKGAPHDGLYQEIGLESLAGRRWSGRIFFFHKIVNGLLPSYLQSNLNHYNDGSTRQVQHVKTRKRLFLEESS